MSPTPTGIHLAGAAALVLLLQAPVAWAGFEPGEETLLRGASLKKPLAVASWSDHNLFVLEAGGPCELSCPGTACAHQAPAKLLYLRRARQRTGAETWVPQGLRELPPDTVGLVPGPRNTLILLGSGGTFTRLSLVRDKLSWKVSRQDTILGEARLKALGLQGAQVVSFVVTAQGSLVVGYERRVLQVAGPGAALERTAEGVPVLERWLAGKAPEPGEAGTDGSGKDEARTRGMVVALDAEGRVLVVDILLKWLYRIDPRTLDKTVLVKHDGWGLEGFQPLDAMHCGNELFVSGPAGPQASSASLVAVAGPGVVPRALAVRLPLDAPFAFTAGGHLAICDPHNQQIRFITNALAKPGEETKTRVTDPDFKSALEQQLEQEQALAALQSPAPEPAEDPLAGPQESEDESEAEAPEPESSPGPAAKSGSPAAREAELDASGFTPVQSHREKRRLGKPEGTPPGKPAGRPGGWPALPPPAAVPPMGPEAWPMLSSAVTTPPAPAWPARKPSLAPPAMPIPAPAAVPVPAPPAVQALTPAFAAVLPAAAAEGKGRRFEVCPEDQQARIAGQLSAWADEGFAAHFRAWALQWRILRNCPAPIPGLILSADRTKPLDPPAQPPARFDWLALNEEAIKQVLQWMLRQAGRANPPQEVWEWSQHDFGSRPRFSFSLFEDRRHPGEFVLEIHNLATFAWTIDRSAGSTGLLRDQLAANEGITGVTRTAENKVVFTYGLKVIFRQDGKTILGILPGGRKRSRHVWSRPA